MRTRGISYAKSAKEHKTRSCKYSESKRGGYGVIRIVIDCRWECEAWWGVGCRNKIAEDQSRGPDTA